MYGTKEIILIGGGGHAKACIDVIEAGKEYEVAGILDLLGNVGHEVLGYPVTGTDEELERLSGQFWFLVTLGQIKNAAPRERIFERLVSLQKKIATVVSPHAYVSRHAVLGAGTFVAHGAKINAAAHIGQNAIINTGAGVEHDAVIGDHVHISTHAIVNGGCRIGNRVFVGSGAVIAQGVQICDDAVIGAGAVIYKDLTESGIYASSPFVKLK